jgi:hypothetical protein
MYDNETWLTPEQAKDFGFVDEVQEVLKAVASADPKNYKHMQEKKTILNSITKMLNQLFGVEPKNVTDTLADGTVIVVESEDGEWAGKKVTLEDGSPLPPGDHALAGGRLLVVSEGGIITEVKEAEPEDTTNTEEMEALKKLEAAEARIKELESALEAQTATATQAVAKAKSFENKLNIELPTLKAEIDKLKNTTVGDTTPPDLGTKKTFDTGSQVVDPMQKFFQQVTQDRR